MIWVISIIFILYTILIIVLTTGFNKVEEFTDILKTKTTSFSVVIPFRNEAENLPYLLKSISELDYPNELIEFILVDDDSTDDSIEIIKKVLDTITLKNESTRTKIRIIKNKRTSNSPKKDAITTAISIAKHNWIVTTDADCISPKNWLISLDSFIQKNNPKMVVAPVNYKTENNFLKQFQLFDFMSMQGTTIGGFGINFPFLCNGANLAYKKEDFIKLNGFDGNNNMASGDDVFLFEKFIEADKNSVLYLKSKDAIVTTFPVNSWRDLINQRTRWAAKTSNFNSLKTKLIGLLVLVTNASFFYAFSLDSKLFLFTLLVVKMIVDLFLFKPTFQFFNHEIKILKWYILVSILYPFFSLYVIFKSVFFRYNWKGRSFKK